MLFILPLPQPSPQFPTHLIAKQYPAVPPVDSSDSCPAWSRRSSRCHDWVPGTCVFACFVSFAAQVRPDQEKIPAAGAQENPKKKAARRPLPKNLFPLSGVPAWEAPPSVPLSAAGAEAPVAAAASCDTSAPPAAVVAGSSRAAEALAAPEDATSSAAARARSRWAPPDGPYCYGCSPAARPVPAPDSPAPDGARSAPAVADPPVAQAPPIAQAPPVAPAPRDG